METNYTLILMQWRGQCTMETKPAIQRYHHEESSFPFDIRSHDKGKWCLYSDVVEAWNTRTDDAEENFVCEVVHLLSKKGINLAELSGDIDPTTMLIDELDVYIDEIRRGRVAELEDAVKDLVHYADGMSVILKASGFEGKADALKERYLKVNRLLTEPHELRKQEV